MRINHIYLIYMDKHDSTLNNQEWLICHKTKSNQTRQIELFKFHILLMKGRFFLFLNTCVKGEILKFIFLGARGGLLSG